MPRLSAAFRLKKASYKVQPPDAENGMSGGVGGLRCAIAVTRPDRNKHRVQLGPRQCRRLLREWEFRYRKPRPVIARSDPLKQAAHKKTPPLGQR